MSDAYAAAVTNLNNLRNPIKPKGPENNHRASIVIAPPPRLLPRAPTSHQKTFFTPSPLDFDSEADPILHQRLYSDVETKGITSNLKEQNELVHVTLELFNLISSETDKQHDTKRKVLPPITAPDFAGRRASEATVSGKASVLREPAEMKTEDVAALLQLYQMQQSETSISLEERAARIMRARPIKVDKLQRTTPIPKYPKQAFMMNLRTNIKHALSDRTWDEVMQLLEDARHPWTTSAALKKSNSSTSNMFEKIMKNEKKYERSSETPKLVQPAPPPVRHLSSINVREDIAQFMNLLRTNEHARQAFMHKIEKYKRALRRGMRQDYVDRNIAQVKEYAPKKRKIILKQKVRETSKR
jgi:hypothetical protein